MKQVNFGSLSVGETFNYNGAEWLKTDKIKISCCKFTNAQQTGIPRNKAGIQDKELVEIKVKEDNT